MPYRPIDTTFGDGSDGHAYYIIESGAIQYLDQPIYQFASLRIDGGVTLRQRKWADCLYPVQRIYCRTPIILDGVLSVAGATAGVVDAGMMQPGDVQDSTGASSTYPPFFHGSGQSIYPIAGGVSATRMVIKTPTASDPRVPFYGENSDDGTGYDYIGDPATLAKLVGPGRLYRFCAGIGGASAASDGGNGGGVIVVTAPAIVFGANGGIMADGEDGHDDPGEEWAGGGGGGGYVETNTRAAVDPSKLSASGGAGGDAGAGSWGGDGMDGLVVRRLI